MTDSTGATTTKNITLTIAAPVSISGPATLTDWTIGRDYPGTAIIAAFGVAPFTWSATGLPSGLTINTSTGVISRNPRHVAAYPTITVTVKDKFGVTAQRSYSVTINKAPSITTLSIPGGEQVVAYSTTVATQDGTSPFTWQATGLPAGSHLEHGRDLRNADGRRDVLDQRHRDRQGRRDSHNRRSVWSSRPLPQAVVRPHFPPVSSRSCTPA